MRAVFVLAGALRAEGVRRLRGLVTGRAARLLRLGFAVLWRVQLVDWQWRHWQLLLRWRSLGSGFVVTLVASG